MTAYGGEFHLFEELNPSLALTGFNVTLLFPGAGPGTSDPQPTLSDVTVVAAELPTYSPRRRKFSDLLRKSRMLRCQFTYLRGMIP
jgi:hypothetical protein